MPESTEDAEKRVLRELEGKNIAHYSIMLKAWIDTRMERDRTLVKLSAAGIGLLATLLTTIGVQYNLEILFYAGAFIGFFTTIATSLNVYQENSVLIGDLMRGTPEGNRRLEKYDQVSKWSFLTAALFAVVIALGSAVYKTVQAGGVPMSKESNERARQSLEGLQQFAPASQVQKSLTGLGELAPTLQQPQGQQTTQG